jgi:hypothetical protein
MTAGAPRSPSLALVSLRAGQSGVAGELPAGLGRSPDRPVAPRRLCLNPRLLLADCIAAGALMPTKIHRNQWKVRRYHEGVHRFIATGGQLLL